MTDVKQNLTSDLMLDLETLGKKPGCTIIQIGACYFNPHTGQTGDEFLMNIDISDSGKRGFTLDPSTVAWWLSQPKEAQECVLKDPLPVAEVLQSLKDFAALAKSLWCHTAFDFPILEEAFILIDSKGLNFRDAMDIRTTAKLTGTTYGHKKRTGIAHTALDDCKFQIDYIHECHKKGKFILNN